MKQNEAVRLALHLLGGQAKLDKITYNALMLKHVDWSNAQTPQANIRRIVRNDEYIEPIEGCAGRYRLVKPIPEELQQLDELADDWLERVLEYRKLKADLDALTLAMNKMKLDAENGEENLHKALYQLAQSIPVKSIVDYCTAKFNQEDQDKIKLMLYEYFGDSMTNELRKVIQPLGSKDATTFSIHELVLNKQVGKEFLVQAGSTVVNTNNGEQ